MKTRPEILGALARVRSYVQTWEAAHPGNVHMNAFAVDQNTYTLDVRDVGTLISTLAALMDTSARERKPVERRWRQDFWFERANREHFASAGREDRDFK
jgi:hypothetical protein